MRYCSGLAYPRSCIFTRGKSVLYPWSSQLILPSSCPPRNLTSYTLQWDRSIPTSPPPSHCGFPPQLVITHPSTASPHISDLPLSPHPSRARLPSRVITPPQDISSFIYIMCFLILHIGLDMGCREKVLFARPLLPYFLKMSLDLYSHPFWKCWNNRTNILSIFYIFWFTPRQNISFKILHNAVSYDLQCNLLKHV